jgi:hypothetical protein
MLRISNMGATAVQSLLAVTAQPHRYGTFGRVLKSAV